MAEKSRTLKTLRASAALAASGAWAASDPASLSPGSSTAGLLVTYARGGVSGAPALRIEVSPDGVRWFLATLIDATISPSAPYGRLTAYAQEIRIAAPASADAVLLEIVLDVSRAAFVRVSCAEYGNTGAPGTLTLELVEGL